MALQWPWAIRTSPPLALSAPCRVSRRTKWVNPVTSGCCLARLQGMPRLPRAPLHRDSPPSPGLGATEGQAAHLGLAHVLGAERSQVPSPAGAGWQCGRAGAAHTGRAGPRAPARDAPPQRGKFSVAILSLVSHQGWFPCDNNHASSRGARLVRVSSCPGYWRRNHGNDLDQYSPFFPVPGLESQRISNLHPRHKYTKINKYNK